MNKPLLWALLLFQDQPQLKLGEVLRGGINDQTPVVASATLTRRFGEGALRRKTFQLRAETAGQYSVALTCESFAAWLVVRGDKGVVAEMESASGTASLVVELSANRSYSLDVCAVRGGLGNFGLRFTKPSAKDLLEHRLAALRRGLETAEREGDAVETARAQSGLAGALSAAGRHAEAEPLFRRVLATNERVLGDEHPTTALSLGHMAGVLRAQGKLAEAEALFRRALAIFAATRGGEDLDMAMGLNNLAWLLKDQGKLAEAESLFRRALAICENAPGGQHVAAAMSLTNLAWLLQDQGKFAEAEPLCRRALTIREQALGGEHRDTAASLRSLAWLLRAQRKFAEAEPLCRRAVAICESALGAEHPEMADSLNDLGLLLQIQGRPGDAEPLFRQALAIYEKTLGSEHRDTAAGLNNLGDALRAQGKLAEAEPLFRHALAMHEQSLGGEHRDTADTVNNLALVLQAEGKRAEAEPLFRRALAVYGRVLGAEHPRTAAGLNRLLDLTGELGLSSTARGYALRLVDVLLGHASTEILLAPAEDRFLLSAGIEGALGKLLSTTALDSEAERDALFSRLASWKGLAFRASLRTRDRLMGSLTASQQEMVSRVQRSKARLSNLAYARDVKDREAHARLLGELQQEKRQCESELLRGLGLEREFARVTAEDLGSLLPEGAAFLDLSVRSAWHFAEIVDGRVTKPGRWESPHVHAWIVRAGVPTARHIDLGQAESLERAVSSFLAATTSSEEPEASRGESLAQGAKRPPSNDRLRALLWQPLAGELGTSRTVLVCPDRFLARVPFETIQLEGGEFLIEQRQFVYTEDAVTLAALLRGAAARRAARPSLFCIGGVDYESRGKAAAHAAAEPADAVRGGFGRTWHPLLQTRPEVEGIVVRLNRRFGADAPCLLLGDEHALEERIKVEAPRFSILHLATHGFFEPTGIPSLQEEARKAVKEREETSRMPGHERQLQGYPPGLLSGLVLAGANASPEAGRDDGYLTAEEVDALPLASCDLVVLSACETGIGTTRGGEGMLSVRRAFREAGAKTVIGSLWRVPDESTRTLMDELYRRMWDEGQSPAEALRAAQVWLLAENRRRNASAPRPSTWGAFVASGEWR